MTAYSKNEVLRYRHILGFEKSKKYLEWMKKKFPNMDIHHILGSYMGKKMTDLLVVPINHKFHIEIVTGNEGKYFLVYLPTALKYLQQYAKECLNLQISYNNIEPETVKQLIATVHEKEKEIYILDEAKKWQKEQ